MTKLIAAQAAKYCLIATCIAELAIQIIPMNAHSKTLNSSRPFVSLAGDTRQGKANAQGIDIQKRQNRKGFPLIQTAEMRPLNTKTAEYHLNKAKELLYRGELYEDSENGIHIEIYQHADTAIRLGSKSDLAYAYRASAKIGMGDLEGARRDVKKALAIKENSAYAWLIQGDINSTSKYYKEAISDYDKSIQLDPSNYLTFYNRGVALERTSRRQEAIYSYTQSININPFNYYAYTNKANILFGMNDRREACNTYKRAIQIANEYPSRSFAIKAIKLREWINSRGGAWCKNQ